MIGAPAASAGHSDRALRTSARQAGPARRVALCARCAVTADRYSRPRAQVDKVVAQRHVAGDAPLMLAGQLDADIVVMQDVAFDHNARAAVHIDTVGAVIVGWIGG